MFDVFYIGPKPNLFPFELPADNLEDAAKLSRTEFFWYLNGHNDYTGFDFDYHAVPWQAEFVHTWPSQWQRDGGTYLANKFTMDNKQWHFHNMTVPRALPTTIFFIDTHNSSSKQRYNDLIKKHPNIQHIRYVDTMLTTIKRCANKSTTKNFWVITSENIYDQFDLTWHPDVYQTTMTHVFGSQWQKWSNTFYIDKEEFLQQTQWVDRLEQLPNLNFVTDQQVIIPDDLYDIYYIDHTNNNEQLEQLKFKYPKIKTTRFVDNYLDSFKRIISTATTEYVWIISSLCDYSCFDFSWQPEPWQQRMVHVFPSGDQKYGDTFYINVSSFKQQMDQLELLDWFEVINYCSDQTVNRLPIPVHYYSGHNLVDEIKQYTYHHPYTWFVPVDLKNLRLDYNPKLWREKDREIVSFTTGNGLILAPRDCKKHINTQVYDYPYITKLNTISENPLDIIYISNGETIAEKMYEHLVSGVDRTVQQIQNVAGRDNALKAAAELSNTEWFFAVPAKLEVDQSFDWSWQPDRLQEPKHYIFHARNPVNGLVYGHMAMVAYNKQLVLETTSYGLDFTMSKLHAVIPLLSGVAHYNADPLMTWRTAFREVIKLIDDTNKTDSIESQYRLNTWLTVANGVNADWSILGARDAVDYYKQVDGAYDKLMLSFDWDWLKEYYTTKY